MRVDGRNQLLSSDYEASCTGFGSGFVSMHAQVFPSTTSLLFKTMRAKKELTLSALPTPVENRGYKYDTYLIKDRIIRRTVNVRRTNRKN